MFYFPAKAEQQISLEALFLYASEDRFDGENIFYDFY